MSERIELIRLHIEGGNEPVPTVPEIDPENLISDETLDRILSDIEDGSYTRGRIDEGTYR